MKQRVYDEEFELPAELLDDGKLVCSGIARGRTYRNEIPGSPTQNSGSAEPIPTGTGGMECSFEAESQSDGLKLAAFFNADKKLTLRLNDDLKLLVSLRNSSSAFQSWELHVHGLS